MKKKTYALKKHSENRYARKDVQIIGETLEQIKEKYGGYLKTVDVVDEARNKKSKLHKYFQWDDTIAGEKYREQQARVLISNIAEVVVVNKKQTRIRSFHSVNIKNQGKAYVSLNTVLTNKDYRRQLLDRASSTLGNLLDIMEMLKKKL